MARGSSIWVVQKRGEIVAAFSVRHEAAGYLFNNGRQPVKLDPKTLMPLEVPVDSIHKN